MAALLDTVLAVTEALAPWGWFVAGAVLMILELLAPGAFLFWFGLAAAATGLVHLLAGNLGSGLPLAVEIVIFAVLALVFAAIGRTVMQRRGAGGPAHSMLNRRGEALVGREFVLAEPIAGGAGRVRVGDSIWRVVGPDAPVGARVRVAGVDGASLVVVAA